MLFWTLESLLLYPKETDGRQLRKSTFSGLCLLYMLHNFYEICNEKVCDKQVYFAMKYKLGRPSQDSCVTVHSNETEGKSQKGTHKIL